MRRNLTYPKDGERKDRETIRQLRKQVSQLRKENSILRNEIENVMKPVRSRKEHVEQKSPQVMTENEWRQEFIRKFRPTLEKRLEELKNEEDEEN